LAERARQRGAGERARVSGSITWVVGDDLEGVVRSLKAKDLKFEHYDLPGMTREGDVHVGGDMKVAWFKDPDGNILSITNR